jgi:hypothetical protein
MNLGHLRAPRHGNDEVRSWRAVFDGVLVAAAVSELYNPLNLNVQGFKLLTDSALRHLLAQVLYQQSHTVILRKGESVETPTLPPSRERRALTLARKPSAVDGTTISFSDFSWAVRSLGQDARNKARKVLVLVTPEIKMAVSLIGPLGFCGATGAATTATYVIPPSGNSS